MEDQRENRDNDPKSFNELYMRIIEINECNLCISWNQRAFIGWTFLDKCILDSPI